MSRFPSFTGEVKERSCGSALHFVVGRCEIVAEQARLDLAVGVVHQADGHEEADVPDRGARPARVCSSVDEPSTALMLTPNVACSFSRLELLAHLVHDFCEYSFGSMLSTDIWSIDSPASFRRRTHSRGQRVAVRDQRADHAVGGDARDQRVELRMQQRLAAGEREHQRAERRRVIDAPLEQRGVDRRRHDRRTRGSSRTPDCSAA